MNRLEMKQAAYDAAVDRMKALDALQAEYEANEAPSDDETAKYEADKAEYAEAKARALALKSEVSELEADAALLAEGAKVRAKVSGEPTEQPAADKQAKINTLWSGIVRSNAVPHNASHYARALPGVNSQFSAGNLKDNYVLDVLDFSDANRRVISAFGAKQLDKPGVHTVQLLKPPTGPVVAEQVNEFDPITSSIGEIVDYTFNTHTVAGALKFSMQSLYEPQPDALSIWTKQVGDAMARKTDDTFATYLKSAAGVNVATIDFATGASVVDAVLEAQYTIDANAKTAPDVLMMSPDVHRWLASLVDSAGAPIFPFLNPMNRHGRLGGLEANDAGGDFLGLRPVISAAFGSKFLMVGSTQWAWYWEFTYPELRANNVEQFAVEVGIGIENAYYHRPEGFCKIVGGGATPSVLV